VESTASFRASVLNAGLPPNATAALRKVERGVKSLNVPQRQSQATPPNTPAKKVGPSSSCSFLGGLLVAEISEQCCTSVQVVTQRQLSRRGMAQECKPSWQCEADGKTPLPTFETQSLSSLCGEPGCLPAVVAAFRSSSLTRSGAQDMSGICTKLASLGGSSADPDQVSQVLTGAGGRTGKGGGGGKTCDGDDCDEDDSACFPGEALSSVQGKGDVPLAQLQIGDKVLAKNQGRLAYEPVLAFLHVISKHSAKPLQFVTVTHVNGAFRASPAHIVFVAAASGGSSWSSKLVGKLEVGDDIFVAEGPGATWDSKPSRVLAIHHSGAQSGMYAPLTSSGTIVVDGVLASNYASSSQQKHLSHTLAHAFFLPVRLYHHLGLAAMLKPMWERLCGSAGASKRWLCHGWAAMVDSETELEELHPYLRVMWQGLKLDYLLPSQ